MHMCTDKVRRAFVCTCVQTRLEGLLLSSTTRVPIDLVQRVEEVIPAISKSLVSEVSRRESYHVIAWNDMAKGRISCQGTFVNLHLPLTQIL